mgnify:CR=1 FL=1
MPNWCPACKTELVRRFPGHSDRAREAKRRFHGAKPAINEDQLSRGRELPLRSIGLLSVRLWASISEGRPRPRPARPPIATTVTQWFGCLRKLPGDLRKPLGHSRPCTCSLARLAMCQLPVTQVDLSLNGSPPPQQAIIGKLPHDCLRKLYGNTGSKPRSAKRCCD